MELGGGLLDERSPERAPRRLQVREAVERIRREDVVDEHRVPLASEAKPHLVGARVVVLASEHDAPQVRRLLGKARERAHEPAVAHSALADVLGPGLVSEDDPRHV